MKTTIAMAALATGLLAGCATREDSTAELRDLPFDVQQTVLQLAPNGDIDKVERKTENDRIVYDISFSDPERYPTLHISADGTPLENGRPIIMRERAGAADVLVVPGATSAAGVNTEDVPVAVLNTIRAHAPNARVSDIDKEVRGQTIYEVQFDDPAVNPKLQITEDGKLVEDN